MQRNEELASIAAIDYHLGTLRPIDGLDFLRDDPRKLELYKLAGFDRYAESDLSMRELARRSAARTLEAAGVARDGIETVLHVAESYDRDELVSSTEVNRLLLDLGLGNSVPIHLSISNCANIAAALRVATALIQAMAARNVLIVSVDKASRRPGGRMMFQEMSIKSDVSVSCLVCQPGVADYGILYTSQHNDAAQAEAEFTDPASYAMPKFRGILRAARQAREALALRPSDFTQAITNNYSRGVIKMFVELCGFPKETGCYSNVRRFAHAVAGDVLINLMDLEAAKEIRSGDRAFLMSDSVTSSSVVCLRRR